MSEDEELPQYSFVTGVVPSFVYNDPEALNLVKEQFPVILRGSDLVAPALRKWNLSYLGDHLGPGPFTVFSHQWAYDNESRSTTQTLESAQVGHHIFKYFDEKKVVEYNGTFNTPVTREELTYSEFLRRFHGDRSKERVYLQQPLNNTVGKELATDFIGFNWVWMSERQKEWQWGPLTSNLLLIGEKGNVTPCHYDEQQNLLCQLHGRKRVFLFSPDNFPNLYSYPVHHPHDRQSQVDLDCPDLQRFPKFCDARGVEAIVNAGDILYIPMYWWHHVVNLDDTIAINFWHKAGSNATIEYPLKCRQKVAMARNIEKMLLEALQDQDDIGTLLHWIVDGRF